MTSLIQRAREIVALDDALTEYPFQCRSRFDELCEGASSLASALVEAAGLLRDVLPLIVCERCNNGRGITNIHGELDECPKCHGEHRNRNEVTSIRALLTRLEAQEVKG